MVARRLSQKWSRTGTTEVAGRKRRCRRAHEGGRQRGEWWRRERRLEELFHRRQGLMRMGGVLAAMDERKDAWSSGMERRPSPVDRVGGRVGVYARHRFRPAAERGSKRAATAGARALDFVLGTGLRFVLLLPPLVLCLFLSVYLSISFLSPDPPAAAALLPVRLPVTAGRGLGHRRLSLGRWTPTTELAPGWD
jgi:hypothetical protein